jgi:hypothetical protein
MVLEDRKMIMKSVWNGSRSWSKPLGFESRVSTAWSGSKTWSLAWGKSRYTWSNCWLWLDAMCWNNSLSWRIRQ